MCVIHVRGNLPGELDWIERRATVVLTRDARAVVAEDDGQIVGMVAFDHWTENAAQSHMAVTKPTVWHRILRPAFRYVFEQAGKGILYGVIPSDRHRAMRFVEGIGFHVRAKFPDGWSRGVDLIAWEMRREGCRFLGRS